MITTQVESFKGILDELKPLLPEHYEELALNKDKVPLVPNYNLYFQREAAGELLTVTLRSEGTLVGYYIGFVAPDLHYTETLTCKTDIFYLAPEYRGKGDGKKLFAATEAALKSRGCSRWFVGIKLHSSKASKPLMDTLGFEPIETYFSKWIGG